MTDDYLKAEVQELRRENNALRLELHKERSDREVARFTVGMILIGALWITNIILFLTDLHRHGPASSAPSIGAQETPAQDAREQQEEPERGK